MITGTYRYLVDWGNTGLFDGLYDDISAYVLKASWAQGASGPPPETCNSGQCRLTLDNSTSIFSSFNAASPLHEASSPWNGAMLPGRRVKITEQIGEAEPVTMWFGYLQTINPIVGSVLGVSTAELIAYDVLSEFVDQKPSVAYSSSITTGTAISAILDACGFSASQRAIDAGLSTISRYYVRKDQTALSAIRDLEEAEHGRVRAGRDGTFIFEDRSHIHEAPHDTPQATYGDGTLRIWDLRQEDPLQYVYNSVKLEAQIYGMVDAAPIVTVSNIRSGAGGSPPLVPAGGSLTLSVDLPPSSGYAAVVEWSTVEFEANTMIDGSGTDITSSITESKTTSGTALQITFTNGSGSNAYLIHLVCHGNGAFQEVATSTSLLDETSRQKYRRREYPKQCPLYTSLAETQAHAQYCLDSFKNLRPRLTFNVMANYDENHLADVQARDVGDRIRVVAAANVFGLGIDEEFIIDSLIHTVDERRVHIMTITCTIANTATLAATTGSGYLSSYTYTGPGTPLAGNVPDDLEVYRFPVGSEITTGAIAWKFNETIDAAEIKYRFVTGKPEYVDLSGETAIPLDASFSGANHTIYADEESPPATGRVYFAYRFHNEAGWSVWSDGNPDPTRVTQYCDVESGDLADDGPPAGWTVTAERGVAANSVRPRSSRPTTHGRRIIFAWAQAIDISVGTWRELDDPAVTLYDGSAAGHTLSSDGRRFTLNSGAGFGTAAAGQMVLVCRTQGAWDVNSVMPFWVDRFENGDPATATWFELTSPLTWRPDDDFRIKIVEPFFEWQDGYLGVSSAEFWQHVNSDGSNGDMDSTEFILPPINIGSADIENVRIRFFFQNGYSVSDDNTYSGPPDGEDAEGTSPDVPVVPPISSAMRRVTFNGDALLGNTVGAADLQELAYCFVNSASETIRIRFDTAYRNGLSHPGSSNDSPPGGLPIVSEDETGLYVDMAANTQGYLIIRHDSIQGKDDIVDWDYDYQNEAESSFTASAWAYWKMEETSGTRMDATGNGHNLGLFHPSYDPGSDAGKIGNCCKMSENNNYGIYTSEGPTLGPDVYWTVCGWHKGSDIATWESPMQVEWGPYITVTDYGSGQANISVSDTEDLSIDVTIALDLTQWHFWAIYYDATGIHVEVDNAEVGSALGTCILDSYYNTGILNPSSNCYGYYDEWGIWVGANALTAEQRAQLWNNGDGWSPY